MFSIASFSDYNFRTLDLGLFIIVHQTQRNTK